MSSALQFIDLFLHINTLSSAVKEGIAMRCFCLPGFLSSELRGFIERGILKKRGPAWEPMESPLDSPGSENTTALMRSTLQNLTPQDVAFLTIFAIAPFAMDIGMAIALASSDEHRARHLLESACAIGYMGSQNDSVFLNSSLFREAISAFQSPEATLSLARNSLNVLRTRTTHQPSQHDALLAAFAVHAHDNAAVIHHALAASHYFESMNRLGDALHYCRLAADAVPVSEIHRHSEIFERVLELLDRIGNTDEFNAIACILQKTLPEDAYLQRINLFKLLAHHHSELLQLRESTRFAAMGMRLAKRQNLRNEISNCLEILAQNQLRQGRPTNAIKTISVCISIRRNEQIVNDYESAFGILAGAYYMEGNYTKALACAVEVLRRLPNRPRDRNKIPVLNNLGILYMESGDLALARKVLSKCRQLAEAWAEFRGISHCHSNLVVFHLYEGDLSQSVIHARRVFQVLEMARALYGYGQSQLSLAEALLLRGQIDDSLDAIAKAQAASVESGDAMNELLARLQKAWVLYHAGAYEQAKASFTEIELPLDKAGYRVHQVSCGLGLSNVETARGEFQFARERLERIYARLPRQHIISDLVYRISKGRYHAAMNEYAQARRSFAAAEALARSHGFRPYVFEAQLSLAQCFLALGESEEAAYYLKRLYGLNERLRYRLLEPWLHLAFADHLASAGDFWEEKRHLLNARTALLELAHNIGDLTLREHFLNRPDSRSLLQRSEDVEDLLYSHSSRIAHAPPVSNALESIARINEQLHRRDSMKSTLSLIVDEALRLSGAERGIIFLFDPSGREELKVARNLGRRSLADARRYTRTALLAIRRGDIVFAADTFTDPTFSGSESITHHRIRSVVCVPLRSRLSIIGALYLDSRRRGLHARPDLLKSLEIFSQQAAAALERAARYFHINEENRKLRENARLDHPKLIGQGSHFTHLKQLIAAAGSSHLPVLILGESGTGKELIARAIHESGPRAEEPFLSVDCGALPDNLVESELFGYRKGAFTGAETNKEGLFVAARGGTIFLDEIANTSPVLQTKLLRAIQEREIRPLGSTESMPFKARIVAATNRDLRKESREGRFRQDLLFRLNGLIIETTPLRNRKGDIPLLIGHFLQEYRHRTGRKIWSMSDQALQALGHHDWPGNVRELQNCIERAMALARGDTIDLGDLPDSIRSTSVVSWDKKNGEHRLIEEALSLCAGDKTRAADYIGWNRQKLYRKMAHYNIPRDFGRRNTA
jgi:Nif-specific regulatory protein